MTKRFGVDFENSVEANRDLWSRHTWDQGGDEWSGQAQYLGVPYDEWKRSLIERLIVPYVNAGMTALEIAAGHGRWSEHLLPLCRRLILVDLTPACLEACKERFAASDKVTYVLNDGKSLPGVEDRSVDFIWSFDSFVHMEGEVIGAYLQEAMRTLRAGGRMIFHHAGRRDGFLWLGGIRARSAFLRQAYAVISMGQWRDHDGWRSNVSRELVARLAVQAGLRVESQLQYWTDDRRYGVPRFNDAITILRKT